MLRRLLNRFKRNRPIRVGDWIEITEYQSAAPVGTIMQVTDVETHGVHYDWQGWNWFASFDDFKRAKKPRWWRSRS